MNFDEEIKEMLLEEHSKSQVFKILDWMGRDKRKMKALMNCFFSNELRLCQRSSWPLIYISEQNPDLLYPYLSEMALKLDASKHDAVRRNTLRIFIYVAIPEELEGILLEKSFEYINDPKQPGGIRAFSIKLATIIILKYPELKEELILSLEDHLPHSSKAFKSAARNSFKKLKYNSSSNLH